MSVFIVSVPNAMYVFGSAAAGVNRTVCEPPKWAGLDCTLAPGGTASAYVLAPVRPAHRDGSHAFDASAYGTRSVPSAGAEAPWMSTAPLVVIAPCGLIDG